MQVHLGIMLELLAQVHLQTSATIVRLLAETFRRCGLPCCRASEDDKVRGICDGAWVEFMMKKDGLFTWKIGFK